MKRVIPAAVLGVVASIVVSAPPASANGNPITVCSTGCTYTTIQEAINAVSADDTIINVSAGVYREQLKLTKPVTVVGETDQLTGAPATILELGLNRDDSIGAAVSANKVILRNLAFRQATVGNRYQYGIDVAAGSIQDLSINNVVVDGAQIGFRVGSGATLDGLSVTNSQFDKNVQGWWLVANSAASAKGTTVKNVSVLKTTFNGNTQKGLYAEKLQQATFDAITVTGSGIDPGYGFNNGIDINLKYNAYSDITIRNSTISGSGDYGTASRPDFPAAVTIKARDDASSYNTDPASLNNVTIENTVIHGPESALRLGEAGKVNQGPTNVIIRNSSLIGDDSSGTTGFGLINATNENTVAINNWWGSADDSIIESRLAGESKVNFSTYLVTGSSSASGPGFDGNQADLAVTSRGAPPSSGERINGAIAIVEARGTIRVQSGIYTEQVTITKPLSLLGPFDDTSPWTPGTSTIQWGDDTIQRAIIRTTGTGTQGAIEFSAPSAFAKDSRIAGLEITRGTRDASGFRATQASVLENVTIENNYIHDVGTQGVEFGLNPNLVHRGLIIRGNLITSNAKSTSNTGIQAWTGVGLTIHGNRIEGFGRGIMHNDHTNAWTLDDTSLSPHTTRVSSNLLSSVLVGIQAANYIYGSFIVRGNDITVPAAGAGGAGLRVHDSLQLTGSIRVANNKITTRGNTLRAGVLFEKPTLNREVQVTRISLEQNSFDDSEAPSIAIQANPTQVDDTLMAEGNFWGVDDTTSQAIIGSIYRDDSAQRITVDFDPWITDWEPGSAPVGFESTIGFWPIPTLARQTPTGSDVAQVFPDLPGGNQLVLTFDIVTDGGNTTVRSFDPQTPPSQFPVPPSGFSLGTSAVYYTITTTATFTGDIVLCLTYDPAAYGDRTPTVYHFTNSQWFARTTTIKPGSPPQACATVSGFSQFALGIPDAPPPPPAPTFPPSAPRDVTGAAGNAEITASWLAPADQGSFPVTSYQAEALPGGASCLVSAPALTCTITGLTNGTTYTLRARALNGAGWSAWSSESAPVTPSAGTPGAPTNATAVAGNAEAVVTWTAPTVAGSSGITGYRVEQSRAGGAWTFAIANTGSTETIATVTSLVNGDSYRFRVSAINAAGAGPASAPSPAVTPEDPETPTILITGQRVVIQGKSGIRVRGETTGLDEGAVLRPWTRVPGQRKFARGSARIEVKADGSFTWQRKTGKSITVYIQAGDGVRSNRVTIPAR